MSRIERGEQESLGVPTVRIRTDAEPPFATVGAAIVGIVAVVIGCAMLAGSAIGADWQLLGGELLAQVPVTVPAALLVVAATVVNLTLGAIVMRALAGRPFRSMADALLAAFVGAVCLDLITMMALGAIGWFRWPVVGAVFGAILLTAWRQRARLTPMVRIRRIRMSLDPRTVVLGLFICLAWAAPIIFVLGEPIVSFNDVLANHVAPPEHLRTYGQLDPLSTSPSPRYTPSRNFLGFIAFQGTLATITDLPAVRSVIGFVLPLTLLVGIAAWQLAARLVGRRSAFWVLVTLPLTFVFLRIPDSRATVTAFPIVVFALMALLYAPSRISRRHYSVVAVALAAGIFVHPVLGALAVITSVFLAIARPERYASNGIAGAGCGTVLALPQLAIMVGIELPSAAGLLPILWAVTLGWAFEWALPRLSLKSVRDALVAATAVVALLTVGTTANGVFAAVNAIASQFPVLMLGAAISVPLLRRSPMALLIVCALGAWALGSVLLAGLPLPPTLIEPLRFEIPKAFGYWVPFWLAVLTAAGLGFVERGGRLPAVTRFAILTAFVVVATLPLRDEVAHISDVGEHRIAESLSINAGLAQRGYWPSSPDPRFLLNAAGYELIGALRDEQRAGDLRADTRVLHIAHTHHDWLHTPIGVFSGAVEWLATEEPDPSIYSLPDRQRHVNELPGLLGPLFPYVVLEPAQLASDPRDLILAAGYEVIFENEQATVFRRPMS